MPKTRSITAKNDAPAWARRTLKAFGDVRVVVVGDVMLDRFWYGDIPRISPEAPVPVFLRKSHRDEHRLGGAANTWHNLRTLGAQAVLVGLVGQDQAGEELAAAMKKVGGDGHALVHSAPRPTTVKTRLVSMTQQVLRLDEESNTPLSAAENRHLRQALDKALANADAVVVSDYAKGVLNTSTAAHLLNRARELGLPVLVDPKPVNMPLFRGATLLSPNIKEAAAMTNLPYGAPTQAERVLQAGAMAKKIFRQFRPEQLVITLGGDGLLWCAPSGDITHQGALAREVYDVSGAGDTVHACLALGLALEKPLRLSHAQMLELANRAAAVAVAKLGTATVSPAEVLHTWA